MEEGDAEAHFGGGGAGERLADCEEFLILELRILVVLVLTVDEATGGLFPHLLILSQESLLALSCSLFSCY